MDSALDDFLKRFGDNDPNKFMTQTQKRKPLKSIYDGLQSEGLSKLSGAADITAPITENVPLKDIPKKGILNTKEMGIGDYAGIAMEGVNIANNFSGKQFDSSAEGTGPGNGTGAALSGAVSGFKAGMATGNPIVAGAGAVVGGLASVVGHSKAMKEYRKNQKKLNTKNTFFEKQKLEEEYMMSEGLESMSSLKSLRQKQLGILT